MSPRDVQVTVFWLQVQVLVLKVVLVGLMLWVAALSVRCP